MRHNIGHSNLYAFVEGGITFKSDQMAHESGDWYQNSKTNYRDHIARRTSGTFELPKSGKSFDTFKYTVVYG